MFPSFSPIMRKLRNEYLVHFAQFWIAQIWQLRKEDNQDPNLILADFSLASKTSLPSSHISLDENCDGFSSFVST